MPDDGRCCGQPIAMAAADAFAALRSSLMKPHRIGKAFGLRICPCRSRGRCPDGNVHRQPVRSTAAVQRRGQAFVGLRT
jgi:hypothetical protein